MENTQRLSADPQPDWAQLLPRDVFREVIRILHGSLPVPDTDEPEDWGQRDRAAMSAVAALRPGNAAEGQLAAQIVLAEAWAADCLRLAGEQRKELAVAAKCRAQASSFMREAKSAWRLLLKVQAERLALEKDPDALSRAEWTEHATLGMMREGLAAEEAAQAACDDPEPVLPVEFGADAEGVSEFGFRSDGAINSHDMRRETEPRFGVLSTPVHEPA